MNRRNLKIEFFALILALLPALSSPLAAAADDKDKHTAQPPNLERIVSVGGAITEILYALNSEQSIVGVDTTSMRPDAAKKLPQVGYMRNLPAEGILSLSPSLLLASASAGPSKIIDQIREAGVPVRIIAENYTPEGVCEKVREIADLLHQRPAGDRLIAEIRADFLRLEKIRAQLTAQPRVMFFMTVSHGTPLVAGTDTPADAMIRLAGGNNAITDYQGFKQVSSESIIAAAPDIFLLTELALSSLGGIEKFYELPGIRFTPAGKNRRVIIMDTLYLLGFGPRSGQAALDLASQMHAKITTANTSK